MRARAARVYILHPDPASGIIFIKIDNLRPETLYFNKSILAGDGSYRIEAKKGDSGRFKRFWSYVCAAEARS